MKDLIKTIQEEAQKLAEPNNLGRLKPEQVDTLIAQTVERTVEAVTKQWEDREQELVNENRSLESAYMSVKDEYSELARAIGIKGDAWWGDPLCAHQEVLQKAKTMICIDDIPKENNELFGFPCVISKKQNPTIEYTKGFTEGFNECRRQVLNKLSIHSPRTELLTNKKDV